MISKKIGGYLFGIFELIALVAWYVCFSMDTYTPWSDAIMLFWIAVVLSGVGMLGYGLWLL